MIKHGNDDALAYTFVMWTIAVLILIPILYFGITYATDYILIRGINPLIDSGILSKQSAELIQYQVLALSCLPLAMLVYSAIFTVNQGVNSYNRVPGDFQTFTGGLIILIICLCTAFLLSVVAVILVDDAIIPAVNTPALNVTTSEWRTAQEDGANTFINLSYFFLYALPLLGYGIYFVSGFRRTSGERYY